MTRRALRVEFVALHALTLMGTVAVSHAAEDGGTRSHFARGAGGRAIGMGGAYVALADDASASIWNPGGLGLVPRLTFEVNHAWLGAADAREEFAAVAVPSWRWGTVAFSLRQLGVDGIDQRDSHNVPIPGDLAVTESELGIGYGRTVLPGVGVGVGFKLQRQVFGDVSATGLGADLGLHLDAGEVFGNRAGWAAPLSFGLVLRNALEPSLRLREDNVPDPRVLRAGVAWSRALYGKASLAVETDVECTAGGSSILHTGAELDLAEYGALRTGFNDGRLAAGMSLRWGKLNLDYAYEERDLGSIQRIAFSHALGRTTSESREAFRAAEDNVVAERLERAFEERQREQLAELVGRADSARAAGRTEEALEAIASARALAPTDSSAAGIEADLLRGEAERLERAGDIGGAALAFARALESRPGDPLAEAGRQRALADLDRLTNHRAGLARDIDSVYTALAAGDLRNLVVTGLYRYVRNPIYVALVAIILGQAVLLGDWRLIVYGALLWLFFHFWVVVYEEPTLEQTFGKEYEAFRAAVPRWIPRMTPWRSE